MDDLSKIKIMEHREMMKSYKTTDGDEISDDKKEMEQPSMDKSMVNQKMISLTKDFENTVINRDILAIMNNRTSKRQYTEDKLSLNELAYLLWMTQGVKTVIGKKNHATLRTVPSAGARHGLETYLFVNRIEGLDEGLYHYQPIEHKLEYLGFVENMPDQLTAAFSGQTFIATGAVTFVWTAIPYRSEWRYTNKAHKYLLLDAGHVCENLYLACESIHCGTCAIGAYNQELADELLGLDTNPSADKNAEFVIYAAPVGKVLQK